MTVPTTRPPSTAVATGNRTGGAVLVGSALSAPLGAMIAPRLGLEAGEGVIVAAALLGAAGWASGAVGKAARDTLHDRTVKMLPVGFWLRLAGLLFVLPLAVTGCALSRSTLDVVDGAGNPVSASHVRVSVLRNGPFANRLAWGGLELDQRGCDQGVSGNATLGAVGIGALAAGPIGAAAGGAAAAAAEWARSRQPAVAHDAGACPAFPARVVPAVPSPLP